MLRHYYLALVVLMATAGCAGDNRPTGDPGVVETDFTDQLAQLSCSAGQMAAFDGTNWACVDPVTDTTLTEMQIETFVTNGALDLASGTTLGGEAILTSDADTLADLACANGQVASYSGSAWACMTPADTVLTESEVEGFVTNGAVDLAAGSTVNGQAVVTADTVVATDVACSGCVDDTEIANLDATKLVGSIDAARLPTLDAGQIDSGTLGGDVSITTRGFAVDNKLADWVVHVTGGAQCGFGVITGAVLVDYCGDEDGCSLRITEGGFDTTNADTLLMKRSNAGAVMHYDAGTQFYSLSVATGTLQSATPTVTFRQNSDGVEDQNLFSVGNCFLEDRDPIGDTTADFTLISCGSGIPEHTCTLKIRD